MTFLVSAFKIVSYKQSSMTFTLLELLGLLEICML